MRMTVDHGMTGVTRTGVTRTGMTMTGMTRLTCRYRADVQVQG